jgi:pimeloyl-ACP methyl ester carboxylesterase
MSSPEEIRLELYGFEVSALCWGPLDGPPMLALHGWLDNAASYEAIAPLLKKYRIVAIDFAGHGKSDWRKGAGYYHFADWIMDAFASADALGWDRFTLMGHSMGAGVASLMAGTLPERIERLICLEGFGPMTTPAEKAPEQLGSALDAMRKAKGKLPMVYKDRSMALERRIKAAGILHESSARTLINRGMRDVAEGVSFRFDPRLRLESLHRFTEEQVLAFLKAIKCPTLVLRANQGWPFDLKMMGARIQVVPNLTLKYIDGGHHVHMDEADSVAQMINNFLSA